MSMGLLTWHSAARTMSRVKRSVKIAATRMLHGNLAKTWYHWYQSSTALTKAKKMLLKGLHFSDTMLLKIWMTTWHEWIGAKTKSASRTRLVAMRLLHRGMAFGYSTWRAAAAEAAVCKNKMRRAVARMQKADTARGFGGWREAVSEQKRSQNTMRRAVMRMTRRAMLQAWEHWMITAAEAGGSMIKMKHCMMRLLFMSLSQATAYWRDVVAQRKESLDRMQRAMMRMGMVALAAAFETWCVTAGQQAEAIATGRAAIQRMMAVQMNAALQHWVYEYHEAKELEERFAAVAPKLLHRGLLMGWNTLKEAVDCARSFREIGGKSVRRMRNLDLGFGFETWRGNCEENRYFMEVK